MSHKVDFVNTLSAFIATCEKTGTVEIVEYESVKEIIVDGTSYKFSKKPIEDKKWWHVLLPSKKNTKKQ